MTEFITRNYGNESFEVIIKTDSKEHYKATQDFARRLIDHAKPVTDIIVGCKWIPVAERLPDHFGVFVVAISEPGKMRVGKDCADFDPFAKTWLPSMCWDRGYKVTHWMPLPDAPKGEK